MRIAQIAPLAESVPPGLYGGTERVVSWITENLVAEGHDVTLFATGDSKTRGNLVPVWPRALRLGRPRIDPGIAQAVALEVMARHATDFDLIHCHADWAYLPLLARLGVPFVTTLHGRLDLPGLAAMIEAFPSAPFVSISDDQRRPLPGARWAATIYHGMPTDWLKPRFEPGEYLAFLGRLSPDKGPEAAIRIARAVNQPLRMAAKIPRTESSYFTQRLQPMIDGSQIRLGKEVNEREKETFLGAASALIFPIDWPEPFGLVMIEAMACGTPVIAFRRGSVAEVVEHGVSGFIVDDEDAAADAVRHLGDLDRREVRRAFERRFTASRMTREYVQCYEALLSSDGANSPRPGTPRLSVHR